MRILWWKEEQFVKWWIHSLLDSYCRLGRLGQVSRPIKGIHSNYKLWKKWPREDLSCRGKQLTLSWPPLPCSTDPCPTGQILPAKKVPPGCWLLAWKRIQAWGHRDAETWQREWGDVCPGLLLHHFRERGPMHCLQNCSSREGPQIPLLALAEVHIANLVPSFVLICNQVH